MSKLEAFKHPQLLKSRRFCNSEVFVIDFDLHSIVFKKYE